MSCFHFFLFRGIGLPIVSTVAQLFKCVLLHFLSCSDKAGQVTIKVKLDCARRDTGSRVMDSTRPMVTPLMVTLARGFKPFTLSNCCCHAVAVTQIGTHQATDLHRKKNRAIPKIMTKYTYGQLTCT